MEVHPNIKYIKDPTTIFERFQVANRSMTKVAEAVSAGL